jgi:hypothetical protein
MEVTSSVVVRPTPNPGPGTSFGTGYLLHIVLSDASGHAHVFPKDIEALIKFSPPHEAKQHFTLSLDAQQLLPAQRRLRLCDGIVWEAPWLGHYTLEFALADKLPAIPKGKYPARLAILTNEVNVQFPFTLEILAGPAS